jgi:transcriptional regulator GlxA family with amidase domain
MAMAGVSIVSVAAAEEGTSASVETAADGLMHPIGDAAQRQYMPTAAVEAHMPQQPTVAPLMVRPMLARPMAEERIAAFLTAEDRTVEDRMAVAGIASR